MRCCDQGTAEDRAALNELRLRSAGHNRAILAVTKTTLMSNTAATYLLSEGDQDWLWDALSSTSDAQDHVRMLSLRGGATTARTKVSRLQRGGLPYALIIEVLELTPRDIDRPGLTQGPRAAPVVRDELDGVGEFHRSVVSRIETAVQSGTAVLFYGEAGTGKTVAARAVLKTRFPAEEPRVLSCRTTSVDEVVRALEARAPLVIAHVEVLDDASAARISERIASLDLVSHVVATCVSSALDRRGESRPVAHLNSGVQIEMVPARYRREDIPVILKSFVRSLSGSDQAWLRPEAIQMLTRYRWPGNWSEMRSVVSSTLEAGNAVAGLRVDDVPLAVRQLSATRPLTWLEQAELDAIANAIEIAGGNKVKAAKMLGISRSRLYRKLESYGLESRLI